MFSLSFPLKAIEETKACHQKSKSKKPKSVARQKLPAFSSGIKAGTQPSVSSRCGKPLFEGTVPTMPNRPQEQTSKTSGWEGSLGVGRVPRCERDPIYGVVGTLGHVQILQCTECAGLQHPVVLQGKASGSGELTTHLFVHMSNHSAPM